MLRDYQQDLISDVLSAFKSVKNVMAVLSTGGGKTMAASAIANNFNRVLWLAHRSELLTQAEQALSTHKNATVWSIFREPPVGKYDLVVLDESHHAAAPVIKKFLSTVKYDHLLGLTATPSRLDQLYLGFDTIIYGVNFDALIANGHLVPIDLYTIRTAFDRDVSISEWLYAYGNMLGKTIIFVTRKEQAVFYKALLEPVFKVETILQNSDRTSILKAYQSTQIDILISCMVLTEGVDLPCTNSIVLARHTESDTLLRQMVGRGIRPYTDKDHCKVIECVSLMGKQSSVSNILTPRNHFISSSKNGEWKISKL
jgi:superfamily II DNA or RNA helicase